MTRLIVLVFVGLAVAATVSGVVAQESEAQRRERVGRILQSLEKRPDQRYIVPRDLGQLVGFAQAAVVGRIVEFGDFVSVDDVSSDGRVMAKDVFASYRVSIAAVLFNRNAQGPPLKPGVTTTITQMIGSKREAELFDSRQFPSLDGREYVLFLWLRPGSSAWSMLQWPLQFRSSGPSAEVAESAMTLPDKRFLLTEKWLDSSVPLIPQGPDKEAAPSWTGLINEVMRLSLP